MSAQLSARSPSVVHGSTGLGGDVRSRASALTVLAEYARLTWISILLTSGCEPHMRVLFIHASRNSNVEYNIHRTLIENSNPDQLDACVVWQDNVNDPERNRPAESSRGDRNYFFDFGRDFGVSISRNRRGARMIRHVPVAGLGLWRVLRKFQPHLIYTSQQALDIDLAILCRRLSGVPHVIHLHYPVGPWLGSRAVNLVRRSPATIVPSAFVKATTITNGANSNSIHVLPNPVDISAFLNEYPRSYVRTCFGWREDAQVVMAAGRLDPTKGHMSLIEAFAHAHRSRPSSRLLICGEGTWGDGHEHKLRERVRQLRMEDVVVFAGQRNDLPALLAGTDVFCLPTENEAFGLVFTEAMVSGVPIAALRSGGVPEIVRHGECGFLSEVGDTGALGANILRLLDDPDLARSMGEEGKRRAFAEYDPSRLAAKWVSILNGFLEGR
jgi:glycosyltransferase involved in cell wall biosynthesis